jgi:hypothetical protein
MIDSGAAWKHRVVVHPPALRHCNVPISSRPIDARCSHPVLEMSSSRSEGLCRREDTLVMRVQFARLSFVNVTMHSSPAMPASVTRVPSKMSSRNAVQ